MSNILTPGNSIFYMKVGTHARETLDEILARKMKEIDDEGFAYWGYGGSTCHPINVVQPFAKAYVQEGGTMFLCMESMVSNHFAPPVRAEEYSVDGLNWHTIADGINVTGSRYAVVIKSIREENFDLPLDQTVVGIGNCTGLPGSNYIKGRVDKACLQIGGNLHGQEEGEVVKEPRKISLVAEVAEPYAVFVRNKT